MARPDARFGLERVTIQYAQNSGLHRPGEVFRMRAGRKAGRAGEGEPKNSVVEPSHVGGLYSYYRGAQAGCPAGPRSEVRGHAFDFPVTVADWLLAAAS